MKERGGGRKRERERESSRERKKMCERKEMCHGRQFRELPGEVKAQEKTSKLGWKTKVNSTLNFPNFVPFFSFFFGPKGS